VSATQTVYAGDCTKLTLGGDFDVMLVDPPYSDHVHKNAVSQSVGGGSRSRDLGFAALTAELRTCIAHWTAHVKRWSIVYSDVEGLHDWKVACEAAGATYIRPIPWVRWSMPLLAGDRPPTGCEFISCFWGTQRGRKSWNGPGNLLCLKHTCLRGDGKHKTEKPLDQALDLVTYFSNPGERVLDLTAGFGTVGLACKILGRDYVGIEIDPVWAQRAQARIDAFPTLSARDAERFVRWKTTHAEEIDDKARLAAHTAKVRAKADAKKANGSPTPVLDSWAYAEKRAYQEDP
jgi:adenine-specific DNA methylase